MKRLSRLTYQQKFKILIGLTFPILFICYKAAFANTVTVYKKYHELKATSLQINDANMNFLQLQVKQEQLEAFLNAYRLDSTNTKDLLGIVSEYCSDNQLVLKEFKPLGQFPYDSIPILTRTFTVDGRFINCLKLVHHLENQIEPGRISSVHFKTVGSPEQQETKLNCTLFIQNLIN